MSNFTRRSRVPAIGEITDEKLVVDTDDDLQRATWIAKELELRESSSDQSAKMLLDLATRWDQQHLNDTD